jgi:hypothetical protein
MLIFGSSFENVRTFLILASQNTSAKELIFRADRVCVNTVFCRICITVAGRDGHPKEFDRGTGEEAARKERLVAGSPSRKTSTAWLEYKPRFIGKS